MLPSFLVDVFALPARLVPRGRGDDEGIAARWAGAHRVVIGTLEWFDAPAAEGARTQDLAVLVGIHEHLSD